ncbi:hypothetical protein KZ843_09660 [Pseudomonas aeruginosa]|nr:hypothetical protein [Pseudomonas aeruginosa]MBW6123151.1 hypothetical protein [Pseudomonas aeruginosa]
MNATWKERIDAHLDVAPMATIGFCLGLILMVIGGLLAPFGAVMWFGFVSSVVCSLTLYSNQSAIKKRLAEILTVRLGY